MTKRRTREELYHSLSGKSIPPTIEAAMRDIVDSMLVGWNDLEMSITAAPPGANVPLLTAFGPTGGVKQYKFVVNDSVFLAGHIKHDIKPGSTMYPHVHWSTDGTSTNTVKWQITYLSAKGHDQESFNADTILTLEEAAAGTAWRHMITEDPVGIPALETDSLFIAEVKRITNGGSENADAVFGLFVDLHYEVSQYATPNRTPDFFA